MVDTRERLARCFTAVFADMKEEDAPRASMEEVEAWDSLASVTLVSLVEERFGVRIEPEEFARFVSFDEVLRLLERKA
jgi:acyl carrier protein